MPLIVPHVHTDLSGLLKPDRICHSEAADQARIKSGYLRSYSVRRTAQVRLLSSISVSSPRS